MERILYFISDLSIAFILSLPLYLLQFQLENQDQIPYNKMLANVLKLPMTISMWIGLIFLRHGSSAGSYLFIVILINFSIYFSFYQFINYFKKGDKRTEEKSSILGLSKKQFIKLGAPALIAIVLIISIGAMSGQKVMGYHHEIINQLEKEENKIEYLAYHAENPGSVISELQYLHEIKKGEIMVGYSAPWRIHVNVHTLIEDRDTKIEFTYIRSDNGWKLDGVYNKSSEGRKLDSVEGNKIASEETAKELLNQLSNQEFTIQEENLNELDDETIISFGKAFVNLYNGAVAEQETVSFQKYIGDKNLLEFTDKILELSTKQYLQGGIGINYGLENEFKQANVQHIEDNLYYLELPFEFEGSGMNSKMLITSEDKSLKLVDFYFGNKDGVDTFATGHHVERKINDPTLWENEEWVKDVFNKLKEFEEKLKRD